MKIRNETVYETRVLHRLVTAMHAHMAKEIGHRLRQWSRLVVTIEYTKQHRYSSGCAYVGGSAMTVRVFRPGGKRRRVWRRLEGPPPAGLNAPLTRNGDGTVRFHYVKEWERYTLDPHDVAGVAYVVWHELMHIYGYRHDRIAKYDEIGSALAPVLAKFPTRLPVTPEKPKATATERTAERYTRLLAAQKRWETKQKRATTALKKLRRQIAGYDRRLAAGSAKEGAS